MFTISAKQALDSLAPLSVLAVEPVKGNPKLAYNLGKTLKTLREEVKDLSKQELDLLKEFGAKELEPGKWGIAAGELTGERLEEFNRRRNEFYEVKVEVWGSPVTLEDLQKGDVPISPAQCDVLDWLIVENLPQDAAAAAAK